MGIHVIAQKFFESLGVVASRIVQEGVNDLTRRDLVWSVINARLATATAPLSPQEIADGIRKFNRIHASLSKEMRDLIEILMFRDALDAIQDYLGRRSKVVVEEHKDPKSGKTTKVVYANTSEEESVMHRQYIALLGHAGKREVLLEADKLSQATRLSRIANKAASVVGKTAKSADETIGRFLNAFLDGLEGKR